jgi:hypothetical protein
MSMIIGAGELALGWVGIVILVVGALMQVIRIGRRR